MTTLKAIGERIRWARERRGITQGKLAVMLGKTQDAISTYENGTRAIRITELPELAKALGITIESLFDEPHAKFTLKDDEQFYLTMYKDLSSRNRHIVVRFIEVLMEEERDDYFRSLEDDYPDPNDY